MGKQLNSIDILGALADDEAGQGTPAAAPKKEEPQRKAKQRASASERRAAAQDASAGKPSPFQSDLRQKLRTRKQLNFSEIPTFIIEEFERLRTEEGMNKREFFYHLLREKGADIPPYEIMDGRKL